MIETLLLTVARIETLVNGQVATTASGFFFARGDALFLITSRHVVRDDATGHRPDALAIELHTNAENLAEAQRFNIPLYLDQVPVWRQGLDSAGEIDVAAIEIDKEALPQTALYRAFEPDHLLDLTDAIDIGTNVVALGFPLGFYDTLHHMPVARHAIIASSFGLRFQGEGYFLTDARTHRGMSGAPVVLHNPQVDPDAESGPDPARLPWQLLGIHSARLDIGPRDLQLDEALGLNCSWYADILMTLTEPDSADER
jgi:hypothetical protein